MLNNRPKIEIETTSMQKILNIIGYTIFIASAIVSLMYLPSLPDTVPIHFNLAGEADGWGSKYILLLLPFIGIITLLPMESLEKKPHLHNYPSSMNEHNMKQYYAISMRTMNLVKNGTLVLFGLLQIEMVLAALESEFSFGITFIVIIVVLLFLPMIWHFMSIRQVNKETKTD